LQEGNQEWQKRNLSGISRMLTSEP
jgi:hypothetical protein